MGQIPLNYKQGCPRDIECNLDYFSGCSGRGLGCKLFLFHLSVAFPGEDLHLGASFCTSFIQAFLSERGHERFVMFAEPPW